MTSAGYGWQHLRAAICDETPVTEAFVRPPEADLMIVVVTSGMYRIESSKRGIWHGADYHPGSVGVTAPNRPSLLRWRATGRDPLSSVHLGLSATLLDQTLSKLSA